MADWEIERDNSRERHKQRHDKEKEETERERKKGRDSDLRSVNLGPTRDTKGQRDSKGETASPSQNQTETREERETEGETAAISLCGVLLSRIHHSIRRAKSPLRSSCPDSNQLFLHERRNLTKSAVETPACSSSSSSSSSNSSSSIGRDRNRKHIYNVGAATTRRDRGGDNRLQPKKSSNSCSITPGRAAAATAAATAAAAERGYVSPSLKRGILGNVLGQSLAISSANFGEAAAHAA